MEIQVYEGDGVEPREHKPAMSDSQEAIALLAKLLNSRPPTPPAVVPTQSMLQRLLRAAGIRS